MNRPRRTVVWSNFRPSDSSSMGHRCSLVHGSSRGIRSLFRFSSAERILGQVIQGSSSIMLCCSLSALYRYTLPEPTCVLLQCISVESCGWLVRRAKLPLTAPWAHIQYVLSRIVHLLDISNDQADINFDHNRPDMRTINYHLWTMPIEFHGSCAVYL